MRSIEWEKTALPEYKGGYAVVLDHVLSSTECGELMALAESSVLDSDLEANGGSPWQPARVNAGAGYEMLLPNYRNGDRIIWDCQEVVDRIWARIEPVEGIRDRLARFNEADMLGGDRLRARDENGDGVYWKFRSVNKRMRFLRYGPGQFFRPHCDGPYAEEGPAGELLMTHFTVHIYLNDSRAEADEGDDTAQLVGGATTFFSADKRRRLDVNPKAGRVLIFQHRRLYHSGDDVVVGEKYTVRTDIMYESVGGGVD